MIIILGNNLGWGSQNSKVNLKVNGKYKCKIHGKVICLAASVKTIRLGIRSCSRGGGWIKICGVNLIPWNRGNRIGAQNQIQKRVITSTINRMPQSLVRCEFAFKLSGFVDQLLRADWWNEFWRKKCVNNGNFPPSPCPDYSKRINTAVLGLCKVCLKGVCLPLWEIPEMGLTASTQSSRTDRAISYTAKEYIICYNQ